MARISITAVGLLAVFSVAGVFAQDTAKEAAAPVVATATSDEALENLKGKVDGLNESYLETKATVDKLSKIKVSGYIQSQFNYADTLGTIGALVKSRFLIKRGRVKTTYDAGLAKYCLELDATQDGVGIKDAFVSFTEPWFKTAAVTIGSMDRPFGYEVSYSSSMLESPERSKVIGTLFPKEKDLGAMVELASEDGLFSTLNFKAGVYNGMTNILNENDSYKDVIGRLGIKLPFKELGLDIDGGVSEYIGKVTNQSSVTSSSGNKALSYEMNGTSWKVDTSATLNKQFDRQYTGIDAQLYYDLPVIGGTCIKGEYVFGKNPGTAANYSAYGLGDAVGTGVPLYERECAGYYAYFVQNINPLSCQIVLKYDLWDPNTKVSGNDLTDTLNGKATKLSVNDLAVKNFGFGVNYFLPWMPDVRLMFYYEMPKFEKPNATTIGALKKYVSDINQNLFTFRVQYKF